MRTDERTDETPDSPPSTSEGTAIEDVAGLEAFLGRPSENPVQKWFLLTGSRMAVTSVLLLAVGLVLVLASFVKPIDVQAMLTETTTVDTLFSSLLRGAILLVSIVVSINSVVFSQEITDIHDQEDRIAASLEYRQRVEDYIDGDVIPARPAEFLRVVLYTILRRTWEMEEWVAESTDEEFQLLLETYLGEIQREVHSARETLGDPSLGTFRVLLVGLNYDYSGQLHVARRFKREYADSLTDEQATDLDQLIELLTFYATGREYFKSLYYERELAHLSSRLLYVSLPVIVYISFVVLAMDTDFLPAATGLRLSPLLLFVVGSYVVALTPFVVLTAYVVRLMNVTLRTLASGPFVLEKGSEFDGTEWGSSKGAIDWDRPEEAGDD